MRVLTRSSELTIFGPFTSSIQTRWSKRPSLSARSRLEDRTRDSHLDHLAANLGKLAVVLNLRSLLSRRRSASRWFALSRAGAVAGEFVRRHPHVFETCRLCFRSSDAMADLEREEERLLRESEVEAVARVKRIVAMSVSRSVRVHALRLVRRELGLPEDFRYSVLGKNSEVFRLVGVEVVELVGDGGAGEMAAEVEKWREREYREKWLSEFETRYEGKTGIYIYYKILILYYRYFFYNSKLITLSLFFKYKSRDG